MYHDNDGDLLELHVGTRSPYWRLGGDSNALELAAVRGLLNLSVALDAKQAAQIRALTGITSAFEIEVLLFGEAVRLHMVGRKHEANNWAGTASAFKIGRAHV